MNNQQPWVRIYKEVWTNHQLASTLRGANRNGQYPPLWFEMKCLDNLEHHDGHLPFAIYVPIDERGINLGDVNFHYVANRYLPAPDIYKRLLISLSGCYQENIVPWSYNVSNAVNRYLAQRRYEPGKNGDYSLPYQSPRIELDFGLITVST